jgi:hypothetical protein
MSDNQGTSVAVFAHNSKAHYSGGRYHAFVMALSLVNAGFKVTFVTDNIPVVYQDFEGYQERDNLNIKLVKSFKQKYLSESFDTVILVPGMDGYHNVNIYQLAVRQKKKFGSKLILLNFESPNWFNKYSPKPRAEYLWAGWRFVAAHSDVILSMTEEAIKYAKTYYDVDDARHFYCYPAINDQAVQSLANYSKEKNIICFYRRVNGAHKGGDVVQDLMIEEMKGYTIKFFCGFDRPEDEEYDNLKAKADLYSIKIDIISKASDYRKFFEYKKARLLIFPSQFEGFGYPPVEALASGASCVCYDLPVLKETCGNKLIYAKHGDVDDLRDKIRNFLTGDQGVEKIDTDFVRQHSIEAVGSKLSLIISDINSKGDDASVKTSVVYYHYLIVSFLFAFYRLMIFVAKRSNLLVKGRLHRCARLCKRILGKIRNIIKCFVRKFCHHTKRFCLITFRRVCNVIKRFVCKCYRLVIRIVRTLRNIIRPVFRLGFRVLRKSNNVIKNRLN